MDELTRMTSEIESLAERARGEDSLLALDILRFADKWVPVLGTMLPVSPLMARKGPVKPLDMTGLPTDTGRGKIDSGGDS